MARVVDRAAGIVSRSVASWPFSSRLLNSRSVVSKLRHDAGQRVSRTQRPWALVLVMRSSVVSGKYVSVTGRPSRMQVAVQELFE